MPAAIIKLECIGDGWGLTPETRRLARTLLGPLPVSRNWVAEIVGRSGRYGYERQFVTCKKDYTDSNSVGSRGVYAYYIVYDGHYYEVQEPVSWKNSLRYFCTVVDGEVVQITKEEMEQWLNAHSESTSTQQPASA